MFYGFCASESAPFFGRNNPQQCSAAACFGCPKSKRLFFAFFISQEEDIRKRTSAAGINADAASAGLGVSNALGGAAGGGDEATQELAAAVESLPKLLEQKKGLEMHTNILKVHTHLRDACLAGLASMTE